MKIYLLLLGLLLSECEVGSVYTAQGDRKELKSGNLVLNANQVFFSPTGTLQCEEDASVDRHKTEIQFDVKKLGTNARTTLYWGEKDMLTFDVKEDWTNHSMWEHSVSISVLSGTSKVYVENLKPNTKYYYSVKIENDEGISWMMDTQSFTTKE